MPATEAARAHVHGEAVSEKPVSTVSETDVVADQLRRQMRSQLLAFSTVDKLQSAALQAMRGALS